MWSVLAKARCCLTSFVLAVGVVAVVVAGIAVVAALVLTILLAVLVLVDSVFARFLVE